MRQRLFIVFLYSLIIAILGCTDKDTPNQPPVVPTVSSETIPSTQKVESETTPSTQKVESETTPSTQKVESITQLEMAKNDFQTYLKKHPSELEYNSGKLQSKSTNMPVITFEELAKIAGVKNIPEYTKNKSSPKPEKSIPSQAINNESLTFCLNDPDYGKVNEHIAKEVGNISSERLATKLSFLTSLAKKANLSPQKVQILFEDALKTTKSKGLNSVFALDAVANSIAFRIAYDQQYKQK